MCDSPNTSLFTFYNIYIKTELRADELGWDLNLHSTIFILKRSTEYIKFADGNIIYILQYLY